MWLIAERFEFERINALYPYFLLGVFFVSLVAFQTELRRLLLRFGEGGWLRGWVGGGVEVLDPVMLAVERLAKRKIGALIAIERATQAGAIAETGVPLDAVVTAELLETIFWPGSALHDLGVLIRDGRVRAAGCQFPLADSGDVERSLGSRHRAAVGMSHETDAVVIVVSEETGKISVAINGRIRRSLSRDQLKNILATELRVILSQETSSPPSPQNANGAEPPTDSDPDAQSNPDPEPDRSNALSDDDSAKPAKLETEVSQKDGAGQAA